MAIDIVLWDHKIGENLYQATKIAKT